jgi:polyhydroxybutyrate depolymerase
MNYPTHTGATLAALWLAGVACSSNTAGSKNGSNSAAETNGPVDTARTAGSAANKVGSAGSTVTTAGRVDAGARSTGASTPSSGGKSAANAGSSAASAAGMVGRASMAGSAAGTGTASTGVAGTNPPGAASEGCGSANVTSACQTKGNKCTLNVSSKDRSYYVQLPSGYNPSNRYPVIFQFHPWGGSADQALVMYQLNAKIPGAIYITPQGLDVGGNGAGWANSGGEDIAFTKAMLADVQGKYCVDKARIFSTGFSYGGMMSFAIGCEMSDVFRAIAPMAGSLYSTLGCKGTGPHVAMWGSHGLSDNVVPLKDGQAARDKILNQNHCGTMTTPVDPSPCVRYEGCDPGYEVTWCEWNGQHGIPNFGSAAVAAFFKTFL